MTATSGAESRALPRTIPLDGDEAAIRSLLDAILANSAEAIVVVDELGDIRFATHGVAELMGHDPETMVGTSAFGYVHPDDVEDTADLFVQRLDYDGRDPGKDVRVRHSCGDWIEVAATVSLLPAFGSAAITMRAGLGGSRERSLQRRIAVAEFANQLGADLMDAAETDAVFARISQSLREIGLLTGAEIVTVHLERQDRDGLELLDGWRSPTAGAESPIEIVHSEHTVERLLTEHIVADDLTLPRHGDLATLTAPLHATGLLSTPFATGTKRGVVMLLRTRLGTSWWDSDGELARSVANLYGRVIHSAWSEELLASTYRDGPVAFSIRTWDGKLVDCNQRYLDLLGLTRRQAAAASMHQLLPPTTSKRLGPSWRDLRTGRVDRLEREFEVVRGDGTSIWVRGHSVRLQVPGFPEQFVLTAIDDITKSHRQRLDLEYSATHDALTGVANRSALYAAIDRVASRTGQLPTLFMVDLDRFKLVNDGFGHAVGDAVLTTVSRRLEQHVRREDLVARLGGDEFAVMVPGVEHEQAIGLARRLRRSLEGPLVADGRSITQTVSIGVAAGSDAADLSDLLVRADRALYSAKHQGRNQHVLFDDSLHDEDLDRLSVERDLRQAIDRDELEIYLQPEFTVADRRIVGAEALVRWRHPTRGLIAAAEFIPVAEESGLIDEVGRFALRRATKEFAGMCSRIGDTELVLRVNISAGEFSRPELSDLVTEALRAARLHPSRLCLEITETTLMDAADTALTTLDTLHALGVTIAIDDFGTGYSSLAYLKRFAVDAIKIDGGFVRDIVDDASSRAIVQSVIGLCDALSLAAVAEGVETDEQLATLARIGCTRAQGFLVAPALPVADFETLVR